jgi:hypothetical protein
MQPYRRVGLYLSLKKVALPPHHVVCVPEIAIPMTIVLEYWYATRRMDLVLFQGVKGLRVQGQTFAACLKKFLDFSHIS